MAIQAKVLRVGSDILIDLQPGRVRRTIYTSRSPAIGPMTAFLIGLGTGPLMTGAGRALMGASPRTEAREKLESQLLEAKLRREQAETDAIREKLRLISREFDPVTEEERALKLTAIRESLPLDLARGRLSLEKEDEARRREAELFPLIMEERRFALENEQTLAAERALRTAEAIQTERTRREHIAAETERARALTEQLEQQQRLVDEAIGPLDQAQASQFLRERLFPPEKPRRPAPIGALSIPPIGEAIGGLSGRLIFAA